MALDRPLLGIALMCGFCLFAPLADALAKLLTAVMPLLVLMTARFAVQVLILVPLQFRQGMPRYSARVWGLLTLRTFLHLAGVGCMFTSLRYLPLADAVAIAYVMPFIAMLLGWSVLGEAVGWRRLAACVVGFGGTLLVIQPSFASVGWPALWPVGVAVVFAGYMLVTRMIAHEGDPVMLQAVNGLQATAILLALAVVFPRWLGPDWQAAVQANWILLLSIGAIATLSHMLMTWSLRFAPSATVAPMQYLEIPIATGIGWVIFRDFPNGVAFCGILVTIGAGLYVILREQATARQANRSLA